MRRVLLRRQIEIREITKRRDLWEERQGMLCEMTGTALFWPLQRVPYPYYFTPVRSSAPREKCFDGDLIDAHA